MKTLFFVSLVLFFAWSGIRVYNAIIFGKDCGGYLKRAADANTVELAGKELEKALTYMEKNNLMEGYTSVLYRTPDEDIGFWYTNLKSSYEELVKLSPNATPLEKSNMLMKLRETILDEGQSTSVTNPQGISMYPYNGIVGFLGVVSSMLLCVGIIGLMFRD